jgi:predicted alpha/beta superfamily hydrolase
MTVPTVTLGSLTRHPSLESAYVRPRHVDVWCPPGYAGALATRYPVIYMHDGQNLFDASHAYGGQDWGVAAAMVRVMREQSLPGAIIVGVWNIPRRWGEYMPARPLLDPQAAELAARLAREQGGSPDSDWYVKFLAEELKPLIDATYRTLPGREHTFLMGSSMGGLISLYALSERPQTFGGAACLSTHWPAGGDLLVDGMGAALPAAGAHRLYFDFGTAGLDADYEPLQRRMDGHLRAAGYREGQDWLTLKFEGADHNEGAWSKRVHRPLGFLLGGAG